MWKFKQIEPQPARGKLVESMWDDPQWIAEEKYDGDRRIAQFCGGRVRFTGRRKSVKDGLFVEKTDNVPHLSSQSHGKRCESFHTGSGGVLPTKPPATLEGTVLDGEMIFNGTVEGGASKLVTSIMGSLPDEAIAKQIERGWLRYVVFDCLYWKGESIMDRPLEERQRYAACAVRTWDNRFVACTAGNVPKMRSKRPRPQVRRQDRVGQGEEGVHRRRGDHGVHRRQEDEQEDVGRGLHDQVRQGGAHRCDPVRAIHTKSARLTGWRGRGRSARRGATAH
jgi:ATP dependent DNA ligase domain